MSPLLVKQAEKVVSSYIIKQFAQQTRRKSTAFAVLLLHYI